MKKIRVIIEMEAFESDQELLRKIVVENSFSKNWDDARTEWDLNSVWHERSSCICKHSINQNMEIKNRHTKKFLVVGNVCIWHFLPRKRDEYATAMSNLRRIKNNVMTAKPSDALLCLAFKLNILSWKHYNWYLTYTRGTGSIFLFNESDPRFSQELYDTRAELNWMLILGLWIHRDNCHCGVPAVPRCFEDKKFYYVCRLYANENACNYQIEARQISWLNEMSFIEDNIEDVDEEYIEYENYISYTEEEEEEEYCGNEKMEEFDDLDEFD